MNETQKGILAFIIFCLLFAIIPTLFISYGHLTVEALITTYLKVIFITLICFGIYFIFTFFRFFIKEEIKNASKYHICYHDLQHGPQHRFINRAAYKYMLGTVKEPYTLAYIWVMARKYGKFKNLKLTIGNEDCYVWAKYPTNQHIFYKKNGHFIHYNRIGSMKLFDEDKPYKPTRFKVPFIESEEQLLDILKGVDSKIKTMNDVINY